MCNFQGQMKGAHFAVNDDTLCVFSVFFVSSVVSAFRRFFLTQRPQGCSEKYSQREHHPIRFTISYVCSAIGKPSSMKILLSATLIFISLGCFSQNPDLPADFLDKSFHKDRRQKLRESLPPNSVAVFFANPVRNRANDVEYVYHQDPDFYYLTGYKEPDALLFVFKEKQSAQGGGQYDEILFVQPRNELYELWTGRRLGEAGTKEILGFEQAFNNSEFRRYNVDFTKFDKILFFDFRNDVRDSRRDSAQARRSHPCAAAPR